jgi:hypothetical protein
MQQIGPHRLRKRGKDGLVTTDKNALGKVWVGSFRLLPLAHANPTGQE